MEGRWGIEGGNQAAITALLAVKLAFIVSFCHKTGIGTPYESKVPMEEFEDQEYAKDLLHLAKRVQNAPNFIQTLSMQELQRAWRWIDDNVVLKTSGPNGEQWTVSVITHERVMLEWLFKVLESEITSRDRDAPARKRSAGVVQNKHSNEKIKTVKLPFMNKRYIYLALIIFLLGGLAVYLRGGKISVSKDGLSYERPNVPKSTSPTESVVSPSSLIAITGTISLNGEAPRNGEIKRVYLKDNTLVQPVTPDGNAFILRGVHMPKDNIVRVALDLQNGQRVSEQFQVPTPKNGVSDLRECLFFSSQTEPGPSARKSKTAITKSTQNQQSDEKIQINNPTFNGPTQIGGQGNIQNNQFGLKPREVSDDLIREIERRVTDKNTPIHILRRSNDAESYDYATKIVLVLIARGYKNSAVDGIIYDQNIGGVRWSNFSAHKTLLNLCQDGKTKKDQSRAS